MTDLENDFERRVTEALRTGADEAPDATGLVVAARRRARRRRQISGGLVVGVSLAIVAVPIGVVALGGDSPSGSDHVATEPTSSPATPEPTVPAGWQVQRWSGLEVAVPGDWTPGTRSSWCAGPDPATQGRVERPDSNGLAIACGNPAYSFGLSFGPSAAYDTVYASGTVWQYTMGGMPGVEQFVPGSWLGHWYDGTRLVQVNAADRETVQQVLDSIQVSPAGS